MATCLNQSELRKALRLSLHMQLEECDRIFQQARNNEGDITVSFGKDMRSVSLSPEKECASETSFPELIYLLQTMFLRNFRIERNTHTCSLEATKVRKRPFESVFWSPTFLWENIETDLFTVPFALSPYERCIHRCSRESWGETTRPFKRQLHPRKNALDG